VIQLVKREVSGQTSNKVWSQQNYGGLKISVDVLEFLFDTLPLLVKLILNPGTGSGRENTNNKDIKEFVFN